MAEKKEKQYVIDNARLMAEWNSERNIDISPSNLTIGSNKKVWWKCSKGHEWQAKTCHRKNRVDCPYCAGKKAIKGYNDLQTVNPILAQEWNYKTNDGLMPTDVMANSGKKVWWRCSKGHEWQATIANRNRGHGCPVCTSEQRTSFPEYAIIYYLKKCGLFPIHSYKEQGYELDVYISDYKIAIEYDGYYWHINKRDKDLEKNRKCEKDGITLYRIREGLPSLNDSSIDYIIQINKKDFSQVLGKILCKIIGKDIDINIERDAIAIENLWKHSEKQKSLLYLKPELGEEWNCEKNGNLTPNHFSANSNKMVWWKCRRGHEWQARISTRYGGKGCPYCTGRYPIKEENDLQTVNPTLVNEWNYEKNNGLVPTAVLPNSHKKVWWKCKKGTNGRQ